MFMLLVNRWQQHLLSEIQRGKTCSGMTLLPGPLQIGRFYFFEGMPLSKQLCVAPAL